MGRRRRNPDSDVERLEEEVRELKSLNRTLMRQLKKVNRGYRKIREEDLEEEEVKEVKRSKDPCPTCREEVQTIQVGPRTIKACRSCSWRGVLKKSS